MWKGWTCAHNADAYESYLRDVLFPRLRGELSAQGYRGFHILRQDRSDEVQFVTMVWFTSIEAVRSFAGESFETPVISAKATALLSRHDDRCDHYDLRAADWQAGKRHDTCWRRCMDSKPAVGLRHTASVKVDAGLTVPEVSVAFGSFRDMPPVFATAYLVGFVEATCIEALKSCLPEHQRTVGIHVDLSHSAATPIGMTVTADVELVAVEGRRLRFRVECRDDAEIIAVGFHDRAIVDAAKFLARVHAKRGTLTR